jgi:hypothetical protein
VSSPPRFLFSRRTTSLSPAAINPALLFPMQTALDSHELLHTLAVRQDICFLHQVYVLEEGRKQALFRINDCESPASSIQHRLSHSCSARLKAVSISHFPSKHRARTHKHELFAPFSLVYRHWAPFLHHLWLQLIAQQLIFHRAQGRKKQELIQGGHWKAVNVKYDPHKLRQ